VNNKILNLVKQMPEEDKIHLLEKIKRDYCLEEKKGLLRDDIKNIIFELMYERFNWIVVVEEKTEFNILALSIDEIQELVVDLIKSFDLESIDLRYIKEWSTVKDIVDYIEDNIGESDDD